MDNCFNDIKREELQAFKDRYSRIDLDLIVPFVATVKRSHWVLNLLESFFAQHGLSQGRFAVLIELMRCHAEGPVSPVELSGRYGAKSATITGLVDNLERDGLVERVPNPNDRRRVDLRLTKDGLAFMENFLPQHYAMMEEAFSDLDKEERQTLVDLLSKMYQGISRHLKREYSAEPEGTSLIEKQ